MKKCLWKNLLLLFLTLTSSTLKKQVGGTFIASDYLVGARDLSLGILWKEIAQMTSFL